MDTASPDHDILARLNEQHAGTWHIWHSRDSRRLTGHVAILCVQDTSCAPTVRADSVDDLELHPMAPGERVGKPFPRQTRPELAGENTSVTGVSR
ncbi:hypothetical protein F4561_005256 [Lipingzhangella halophila]|uniref:Uncharacterized protein n=1 Tax=Lipingzhangella halophila TaxID=1783352 RepID=A0A7W7RMZ9_9ACTN|nr:hypothetical protein [Lipingzhangella halophila]MBB4934436.1 hypothetical protein [Lipingzhangella halophila]